MAAAPVVPWAAAGHRYICAGCPRRQRPVPAGPEEVAVAAAAVLLQAAAVFVAAVAAAAAAAKYDAAVVRHWVAAAAAAAVAAAVAAVVLAAAGEAAGAAADSRGCVLSVPLPQPPCTEAGDVAPTRAYTCRPAMPWYGECASLGGTRAPCTA